MKRDAESDGFLGKAWRILSFALPAETGDGVQRLPATC